MIRQIPSRMAALDAIVPPRKMRAANPSRSQLSRCP
jgi:hypothetical protein